MKNRKNISKIVALGAAVALTAAACGSDDAETPVEDDTVTTEVTEEEPVVTDAMEEDVTEEDVTEEEPVVTDAMEEAETEVDG